MEDEFLEPLYRRDGGAEKSAAPAPDVQEPDARWPQPARWARLAWTAHGTPDEVLYEGRSCAVTGFAGATAQLELVSLMPRRAAVALQAIAEPQNLELTLAPPVAPQPMD